MAEKKREKLAGLCEIPAQTLNSFCFHRSLRFFLLSQKLKKCKNMLKTDTSMKLVILTQCNLTYRTYSSTMQSLFHPRNMFRCLINQQISPYSPKQQLPPEPSHQCSSVRGQPRCGEIWWSLHHLRENCKGLSLHYKKLQTCRSSPNDAQIIQDDFAGQKTQKKRSGISRGRNPKGIHRVILNVNRSHVVRRLLT